MPVLHAYLPDDSHVTAEALEFLHSSAGLKLLDQLRDAQVPSVSAIAALRRSFPADAVHAALTLARLQSKARAKFPNLAHPLIYALPEALEQATDSAAAAHKAQRFARQNKNNGPILDLCCGIGGDALALADIAPVIAADLSPARLACLRFNAESAHPLHAISAVCDDVTALPEMRNSEFKIHNSLFHIDPARRHDGMRSHRYEDLIPGPQFLEKLMNQFPGGAIKLSPAVDFDSLPSGHLEIISHDKTVVQAVLWTGSLAKLFPAATRTASVLTAQRCVFSFTATVPSAMFTPPAFSLEPSSPSTGTSGQFLYEADPALTRSQLAATLAESLGLIPLTSDAGYLLGGSLTPHPALTPFHILATIPYSEKRVLAALANPSLPVAPPRPIEVKTRGKIPGIDTDRLQRIFSRASPHDRTVLIYRRRDQTVATIARRVPAR